MLFPVALQGGKKYQEAAYIFDELIDKYQVRVCGPPSFPCCSLTFANSRAWRWSFGSGGPWVDAVYLAWKTSQADREAFRLLLACSIPSFFSFLFFSWDALSASAFLF